MYALCDTHMDTELKSPFIMSFVNLVQLLMHLRGVAFSEQSTASLHLLLNFLTLFLKDT